MRHGVWKITLNGCVYTMKTLTAECYQLKAKLSERISMLYRFENGLDAIDYKLLYTDTFFVNKRIGDENNYDFLR